MAKLRGQTMTVQELIDKLENAKCPDSPVYIAGYGDMPELADSVLFADELNDDKELAFESLGMAMGGLGVLILREEE